MDFDITVKKNFVKGMLVDIIADKDNQSGKLTRGYITTIISKENNKKGIRVKLNNGKTGRVYAVPTKEEIKLENFKFYNKFFFGKSIYSIWDNEEKKYAVLNYENVGLQRIEQTIFLFDSELEARDFVKGTIFGNKRYSVRAINRKKPIVDNFKTLQVDYFRINKERKLSFQRMIEWENYFKNMR